ncbi:hypothetical protein TNCT6_69970 [Streptomyces sp. 6-11-2]|nr:hypothetical protein TNCT6_69970 [Streptomyces sp. 6-11-2]
MRPATGASLRTPRPTPLPESVAELMRSYIHSCQQPKCLMVLPLPSAWAADNPVSLQAHLREIGVLSQRGRTYPLADIES